MNISINWNLGNFNVNSQMEVGETQLHQLARLGALYIHQRASKVDKTLGGFIGDKRKPGWRRGDVEYSVELAEKLTQDFAELAFPKDYAADALKPSVVVTEYVREISEPKYKLAQDAMLRHESAGDLEEWLAGTIKFDGPTHGEDGEYNVEALRAITEYVKRAF